MHNDVYCTVFYCSGDYYYLHFQYIFTGRAGMDHCVSRHEDHIPFGLFSVAGQHQHILVGCIQVGSSSLTPLPHLPFQLPSHLPHILTSPHLSSPYHLLTSCHLPHLTTSPSPPLSPLLTSSHLTSSSPLTSFHLTSPLTSPHLPSHLSFTYIFINYFLLFQL